MEDHLPIPLAEIIIDGEGRIVEGVGVLEH
jgi:hypothetical protein